MRTSRIETEGGVRLRIFDTDAEEEGENAPQVPRPRVLEPDARTSA